MDANTLSRAVQGKVEALQAQLRAKVEANLSGDVLQARSGALRSSIEDGIDVAEDVVTAKIASTGVPYAAIQEYGGHTGPHEIVAVKARALAFAGFFARRVAHPGAAIPARAPLGQALESLRPEIGAALKDAVRTGLGIA